MRKCRIFKKMFKLTVAAGIVDNDGDQGCNCCFLSSLTRSPQGGVSEQIELFR